jgi:hypothetical protein
MEQHTVSVPVQRIKYKELLAKLFLRQILVKIAHG